jgi:hypothetical protein
MVWNIAEDSHMEQVNTKRPVRYCGAVASLIALSAHRFLEACKRTVALAATARYRLILSSVHSARLQDTISILVPCNAFQL